MSEKNSKPLIPNLHKSKRYTGSDINTKKKSNKASWRRFGAFTQERLSGTPDLDSLLDAYWGGPEPRISGLTIRIIAVNAVALLILLIGIIYLGQYQNSLINAKLETFQAKVDLVSAAIAEGSLEEITLSPPSFYEKPKTKLKINENKARNMVRRLGGETGNRVRLFNDKGLLIADSHKLTGPEGIIYMVDLEPINETLYSIEVLKRMVSFAISFLPDRRILPLYKERNSEHAKDYIDAANAILGNVSITAWSAENDSIFLSAASPVTDGRGVQGAVMLTRLGEDIEREITQVWLNILKVFAMTVIITILLSIYLSGVIARPLRKLANAAELVRTGQGNAEIIPDYSKRYDEIGELSIALRDMTQALNDRMDSIEQFAADVSHELKNPLTSLKSAAETASIVKKKEDKEKLLSIVKHDAERLDRLITDISRASRLDTELAREAFKHIDIKDLLHNLIDIYRDPLDRQDYETSIDNKQIVTTQQIDINLILGSDTLYVEGIEGRLIQVFQNLLTNALSFSKPKSKITIKAYSRSNAVVITVEDEGPGIPQKKLESIFERFYSERPDHEDYGNHSGLGLSICRQIINAHGGRIFAENSKFNDQITGARFTVILNKL